MDGNLVKHLRNTQVCDEVKRKYKQPPRWGCDYRKCVKTYGADFNLQDLPEIITAESKPTAHITGKPSP